MVLKRPLFFPLNSFSSVLSSFTSSFFFLSSSPSSFRSQYSKEQKKTTYNTEKVYARVSGFARKNISVLSKLDFAPFRTKMKMSSALLKFHFGSKRNGFRSHFPRFEQKQKLEAHPTPCALSIFLFQVESWWMFSCIS
jgi:hypothetical protein